METIMELLAHVDLSSTERLYFAISAVLVGFGWGIFGWAKSGKSFSFAYAQEVFYAAATAVVMGGTAIIPPDFPVWGAIVVGIAAGTAYHFVGNGTRKKVILPLIDVLTGADSVENKASREFRKLRDKFLDPLGKDKLKDIWDKVF